MSKIIDGVKELTGAREATGYDFFVLNDPDDMIEYQGPYSRKFIASDRVEEISDPDTTSDFIEVYGKETNETLATDSINNNWQVVDFSEVECGGDGRISVASIDIESGLIFLQRDGVVVKNDSLPFCDEDSIDEGYIIKILKCRRKLLQERENKKDLFRHNRNNRKTMSPEKVQRDNRALLGLVKTRCVEDIFDFNTLLSDQLMYFALSE